MKKVILAFSGGLDTTYCAIWLRQQGYEVWTASVNTGGFDEQEVSRLAERAKELGIENHVMLDVQEEYYQDCIRYLIAGNVLKNNTYPLSVSAERVFQATAIAKYAKETNADAIAHGSTGAGNDQVRFDMVFNTIYPEAEIITPIRDHKLSREEEIEFLKTEGVSGNWEKALYSINEGLWGTSVGGKETLTSDQYLPEDAFPTQLKDQDPIEVTISFEKGQPVALNGKKYAPVDCIKALNEMAAPYAIGRDIHVGDTIIGIKGRVGFEAAAPVILVKAHHLLEKHTLTKHQLLMKDQWSISYGNFLHEGLFLEPVLRDIEAYLDSSQQKVSGEVTLELLPYHFILKGINSPNDLMQSEHGKYGEMNNGWSGQDVRGFSKIFGNQAMIYHKLHGSHE
ncbi:MAG: argininosuccinate synthase [Cytophagales bacterium]|nr:argininosuccinate synthase [Cytophagales bacterium]